MIISHYSKQPIDKWNSGNREIFVVDGYKLRYTNSQRIFLNTLCALNVHFGLSILILFLFLNHLRKCISKYLAIYEVKVFGNSFAHSSTSLVQDPSIRLGF